MPIPPRPPARTIPLIPSTTPSSSRRAQTTTTAASALDLIVEHDPVTVQVEDQEHVLLFKSHSISSSQFLDTDEGLDDGVSIRVATPLPVPM